MGDLEMNMELKKSPEKEQALTRDWERHFDRRELTEIAFARDYVAHFNHGASGHLSMTVIDKLSKILSGELK